MTATTYGTTVPNTSPDHPVLCGPHTTTVILDGYAPQPDGGQRHFPMAGVVLRVPVVYGRRPNGFGMTAIILSAMPIIRRAARDVLGDADAWFMVITSPDDTAHHNTASISAAANATQLGISTTQVLHPRAATLHLPKTRATAIPMQLKDTVIRAAVRAADIDAFGYSVVWRGGPDA